jgi:hypothetical protein
MALFPGACDSIIGGGIMPQARRSQIRGLMRLLNLILPATDRNEYQKQKNKCFWGVEHDWCRG